MRIVFFGIALLLSMSLGAGQGFSSLEERMTGREFRDAGLHKLSDEELATLNRWILQRSLAEGEAGISQADAEPVRDRRGLRGERSSNDGPITSNIVGSFTGWSGNDVFVLENGMVWRQAENRVFTSRPMENPAVEIRPGLLGAWYLSVEGYNSRVKVDRVK